MQIKVLKPGRYMNAELKAQDCVKGDLLDTREWYAQQMVANGTGVNPSDVEADAAVKAAAKAKAQEEAAAKKAEKAEKAKAAKAAAEAAKAGPPANPFLE